jgi:hypothetical protein
MYRLQITFANRQSVSIIGPCRAAVLELFRHRKGDFREIGRRCPIIRIGRT